LRAAASNELNYRMDRSMSKLMGDVLIGIFQTPKNQRAEALAEVLYAIAVKRMRLLREDLEAFLSCVEPQLARKKRFCLEFFLCGIIRRQLIGRESEVQRGSKRRPSN